MWADVLLSLLVAPRVRAWEPSVIDNLVGKLEFVFVFWEGALQKFWLHLLSCCRDGQRKCQVTADQSGTPGRPQIWYSPNFMC